MGGTVKIDKRMMYKKVGIIVVIVGFLSIVETAISKMISTQRGATVQPLKPSILPVVIEKSTSIITPNNSEQISLQPVKGKLSLEQIHALSEGQGSEITRSLRIGP